MEDVPEIRVSRAINLIAGDPLLNTEIVYSSSTSRVQSSKYLLGLVKYEDACISCDTLQ